MTERSRPPVTPSLRDWLEEREPRAPDAVELDPEGIAAAPAAQGPLGPLLAEARAALRDALEGRGERRGAFRLLTADAYVTYACEAAVESDDPRAALLALVRGVASELEGG